ncbi:MAG: metal ABC transporter permease [Acidimicrobiia bacterium]
MRWVTDPFNAPYMQRALLEMVLLSALSALAGTLVLLRRMPFLADSLSHTVFPGVALAFAAGTSLFAGALVAAALSSLVIAAAGRQKRIDPEAVMALLVGSFFSIGVIVVSRQRSFNADLTALLFGRLLTVDSTTIAQTLIVLAVVALAVVLVGKELVLRAFDPVGTRALGYHAVLLDLTTVAVVALVVVAGARAVGTALVITLLISPAATARLITDRLMRLVPLAFVTAMVGSAIGLIISYRASLDHGVRLPPGATVTVVLTSMFVIAFIVTRATQKMAHR